MNPEESFEASPIALVRFGLGKEIRLFPQALVIVAHEEGDEQRFALNEIRRIALLPGDPIPSKLVLVVELLDGTEVIAAEGMSNARDFAAFVPLLRQHAPDIVLDPPDMEEQLRQALANRRTSNLGCYASVLAFFVLIFLICAIGALVRGLPH
jgi:hypothetical protein